MPLMKDQETDANIQETILMSFDTRAGNEKTLNWGLINLLQQRLEAFLQKLISSYWWTFQAQI